MLVMPLCYNILEFSSDVTGDLNCLSSSEKPLCDNWLTLTGM